jgi:hypothetical protein
VFLSEGVLADNRRGVEGGGPVDEPTWHKASQCDSGQCIEIGALGGLVLVRSSADPECPRIALSHDEWQEFVAGVKDGDFDEL